MKKVLMLCSILLLLALISSLAACDKVKVSRIEVDQLPKKTNYYIGDSLDLEGCTISVIYSDNKVETVSVTEDMVSALDTSGIGTKSVIITYTAAGVNYTTSMTLHVVSRPPSSMRVLTPPTKAEYVEGETIDIDGLTVAVTYTEDQVVTVYARDLTYRSEVAVLGQTSVTVGLGNLTLEVPIRVLPVTKTGIEVGCIADCLYRNETLHVGLFEVDYVYNNGTKLRASDVRLLEEGQTVSSVGPMTLHFVATDEEGATYEGTAEVTAVEDEIRSVSLATAPLCYDVGATFAWQAVELSVDFVHASSVRYTMGVDAYADLRLSIADGAVLSEAGAVAVDVLHGDEVFCTFRVAVGGVAPVRWRVEEGEDMVVEVEVGQVPSPTMLMLYAVMSDGSEVLVWHRWRAASGVEVLQPAAAEAGDTTATLVYQGLAYTYPIRVVE